jgi:hypothetical protein
VQHLKPENAPRRITFCQWLLQKIGVRTQFFKHRLKAGFTRGEAFNSHNRYPHLVRRKSTTNPRTYRLIGLHVLPQHLNGEEYLNFLQNVLSDLLDDVPLLVWRDMWYLYDGTLAHKMLKIGDRW